MRTPQQNNQSELTAIGAPYNFVPLSDTVFQPDEQWQKQVSHDQPFRDGVSGVLTLNIRSHTPMLPGSTQGETVKHFTLPDGSLAIPGSSLRGMIRNVLEIASFGKMRLVDDKRYGVRDLTADFYKKVLTNEDANNNKHYQPTAKAGWLNFIDGNWQIKPCEYARVEQELLRKTLGKPWVSTSQNTDRPTAEDKYKKWLAAGEGLEVAFDAGKPDYHPHSKGNFLYYRKVTALKKGKSTGQLVFTGQPGPASRKVYNNKKKKDDHKSGKHMEFVFFDSKPNPVPVSETVIQGFLHIYNPVAPKKQTEMSHWQYLQKLNFQQGIPVFYLTDKQDEITSLGLSQMYRLAYDKSIGDIIDNTNNKHRANNCMDLVEIIFGAIDDEDGKQSLKSRISFSPAVCQQQVGAVDTKSYQVILNSPKPTYYPNYISQNHAQGKLNAREYSTMMDPGVRIRGWKRYPVRSLDQVKEELATPKQNKLKTQIEPVTSPLSYTAKLRYHNLKPEELGALIWAITWGHQSKLRHSIGVGKPFGYGQISLTIDDAGEQPRPNNHQSQPLKLLQYQDRFVQMMMQHIPGWQQTEQIKQLLAMAFPENATQQPASLEHLKLNGGGKHNQFVQAKKRHMVLQDYHDAHQLTPVALKESWKPSDTEQGQWLSATTKALAIEHKTKIDVVLLSKMLASAWQKLDDVEFKRHIFEEIKQYWEEHGGWEPPHTGSRKKAYQIYTSTE